MRACLHFLVMALSLRPPLPLSQLVASIIVWLFSARALRLANLFLVLIWITGTSFLFFWLFFFLFFSFSITLAALTYFLFLGFPFSFRQLRCLGLKDSRCLSDKTWTGLSHINSHRVLGEDTETVPSLYKIRGWRKLFDSFVTEGLKIHEMAPTASGTRVSSSFSVLGLC